MSKLEVRYHTPSDCVEIREYIPGAGSENSHSSVLARLQDYAELNRLITDLQKYIPQMHNKEEVRQLKIRDERIKKREALKEELAQLEALIDPGSANQPVIGE
jgi:hypothetical protein